MVTVRIHVFSVLPGLLVRSLAFAGTISVFLVMYFMDYSIEQQIVVQMIAIAFGFSFIRRYFLWYSYTVLVTPDSITVQQGILRRRYTRIAVGLATVQVSHNFADRALNRGHLHITEVNGTHHRIGPLAEFRRVRQRLGI